MIGVWYTPFPVQFDGEDGTFQGDDGTQLTLDAWSVTVTKGDISITGMASADYTQIQFDNGAKWKKQIAGRGLDPGEDVPDAEQPDLLSDAACDNIIDRLNKKINIWLLNESQERYLIEQFVKAGNAQLKPAFNSWGSTWVPVLVALLDETKSRQETYEIVKDVVTKQFRDPLTEFLNGQIDVPFVGEDQEGEMLTHLVDRLVSIIIPLALDGLDRTGASVHPLGYPSDE